MRSAVQDEIDRLRTQRAAEWLEILRDGHHRDTHAEFMRWITESPLNMDEFMKLDALSRETRAVLNSPQFDRQLLLQAVASQVIPFDRSELKAEPRLRRWGRGLRAGVAAACLVAAIVVGRWTYSEYGGWDTYVAGPSEQRRIDLADGSRVYLNAQTQLSVRMGQAQRELRLSSGEALFDVAKDPQRPFRVRTADAVVEAVGTQFNVNARADGTRVAVIEGKVRISGDGAQSKSGATVTITALEAGQSVHITPVGAIERDHSINVASVASWSRPELVFDGTSLEQAVEQFNRYRPAKRLRLEGVQPGSHHYTGLFDATDSEAFVKLLSREEDLQVETREDEIVIRLRQ